MTDPSGLYLGSCHCQAIGFELQTRLPTSVWSVRACQCGFCRSHAARTTSDPAGAVRFVVTEPSQLSRYRFGLRSADFLVCRTCGVYIATVMSSPRGTFATLNVNTIQPSVQVSLAEPKSYEAESLEQRIARREELWTPVIGS
jgi:hypothetical protein